MQTFAMTMDMIDILSLFLKRIDILIKRDNSPMFN